MRSLIVVISFVLLASSPVLAQAELENYYNYNTRTVQPSAAPEAAPEKPKQENSNIEGARRHIVTSVQKCFEEIGAEQTAKIRAKSLTPYADCQKAARVKALRDKEAAESAAAPEAETPRNFKRVTETPVAESATGKAAETPPLVKKPKKP